MRAEKLSMLGEVRTRLSGSSYYFLTNYTGLTVAKTEDLRRRLRGAKADFTVVSNKQFQLASKDLGFPALDAKVVRGPSAMIYGAGDVAAVAKILKDFIRENQKPAVKAGALEQQLLTPADVDSLAALPSREILLGRVVGTIAAPMSQLVGVLQQKAATLVYALKAYADKKGATA